MSRALLSLLLVACSVTISVRVRPNQRSSCFDACVALGGADDKSFDCARDCDDAVVDNIPCRANEQFTCVQGEVRNWKQPVAVVVAGILLTLGLGFFYVVYAPTPS